MDVTSIIKKHLYVVDLPENDKAIIINIMVSLLYFSYFCIAYFSESVSAEFQVAHLHYLHVTEVLSLVSILCLNVLLAFILYTRKNNPSSTLPSNIQLYFIGQPLALYAILNGIPQLITGLLLGVLPFLGLILFNRKHVFYAACLMWVEIVGLAIAVSTGLLPNAPLFIDQVKPAQVPLAFLLVQILMSAPIAAVVYIMGHSLMQGIVLRENKILELSRRDGLTGLWNRRYLNEVLEHEIALTHRNLDTMRGTKSCWQPAQFCKNVHGRRTMLDGMAAKSSLSSCRIVMPECRLRWRIVIGSPLRLKRFTWVITSFR
jgi:hypothetical protein